jgi:hypothetical protein
LRLSGSSNAEAVVWPAIGKHGGAMRVSAQVLVACGWLAACGSTSQEGEVEESFAALYQDVLVANGCVGCHDADAPGGLDLTSVEFAYQGLVGAAAKGAKCAPMGTPRVAPGDSDGSLLVHKLEGHDASDQPVCGKPMPQMERVDPQDIERVRVWIDQGAEMD